MSGTGVQTTETIRETIGNGFKTVTKTLTEMRWSKLSRSQKWIAGTYLAGCATYGFMKSYNGGKSELLAYRHYLENKSAYKHPSQHTTEWDAVYYGSTHDVGKIFVESLLWPSSITSQIVPAVVLAMNPNDGKSEELK